MLTFAKCVLVQTAVRRERESIGSCVGLKGTITV